ncbi:MAG: hypothetical protein KJ067_16700 [Vicinamibacteria bacterium]|nr:hypothetical protein [Vicinamibacteria bacterium]
MSSELLRASRAPLLAAALGAALLDGGAAPRFYPDDPLWVDRDDQFDATGVAEHELSEIWDLLENSAPRRRPADPGRAHNVNTLDEVPDSSWFQNRIGRRELSLEEIVRGPDLVPRLEVEEWVITGGKGRPGFQPGFRARDARTGALYQLELDLEQHQELATGAEVIGTALYHAIGYNVVDVYLVDVDPRRVRIDPEAKQRDASGRRPFTRGDLDEVLLLGRPNPDGTYRMSASRFVGRGIGNFRHFGTRPDDPNDIHPHEHRRELRANRVFAAWLNHDDSRANNTLDALEERDGRRFVRHYMFDFGSILGSSPDRWWSGHAYMLEFDQALKDLFTLGFRLRPWQRVNDPRHLPPAVGRIGSGAFDPAAWKPEYPNRAFDNMRADDAFWAARIVSRFSDAALRAVVEKARYSDPAVTDYLASTLIARRDRVVEAWLPAVNPVADPQLAGDGTLTFANAAVDAGVATAPAAYALRWSRFDNARDALVGDAVEQRVETARAAAPPEVLAEAEYVFVSVAAHHPDHPAWSRPVHLYFRRVTGGWQAVGLERLPPEA